MRLPPAHTDSASRALVAVVATTPLALVGGHRAMTFVFESVGTDFDSSRVDDSPCIGAGVVALLCACAIGVAAGRGRPAAVFGKAFVALMIAAIACTPATLVALGLSSAEAPQADQIEQVPLALLMLPLAFVFVTVLGGVYSVPLGVAFATVLSLLLGAITLVQTRAGHGRRAALALVTGATWMIAALPLASPTLFVLGAIAILLGSASLARLARLTSRARRGAFEGWSVRAADVEEDAALPRALPWSRGDEVLVRTVTCGEGPFRASERATPIARC